MYTYEIGKILINTDRKYKRLFLIFFDLIIIIFAIFCSMFLRLENIEFVWRSDFYINVSLILFPTIYLFWQLGLYKEFLRFFSIEIAMSVAICCVFSASILFLGKYIFDLYMPRSVPFIYLVLSFTFIIGVRFLLRSLYRSLIGVNRKKIAVYGAGSTGSQIIQSLITSHEYLVKMVIDDDPRLYGRRMFGLRIMNFLEAKDNFEKFGVKTVLIAIPNIKFSDKKKIISQLSDLSLLVKTMPSFSSLINDYKNFKDASIEDLLGREVVNADPNLLSRNICNKTVLITGAGGSIGKELCKQILHLKPKIILLLDISEVAIFDVSQELKKIAEELGIIFHALIGSVQDRKFIRAVFKKFKVNTIYHAAAYKHVPLMENNLIEAIKNNTLGVFNIAEEAIKFEVESFTLISTDKAVNPANIMGASKRMAELICQSINQDKNNTRFSIVRFGNVLGSSGSVVPLFAKQIKNGGPITLTHPDVTRYFMTIFEAVQLVIQASSLAEGREIFVLNMGQPIKIKDLAYKMVQLSGLVPYMEKSKNNHKGDILINITGLRPGEKLKEELSYDNNFSGTRHPRIVVVDEKPMSNINLRKIISELEKNIDKYDYNGLIDIITKEANYVSNSKSDHIILKEFEKIENNVIEISKFN